MILGWFLPRNHLNIVACQKICTLIKSNRSEEMGKYTHILRFTLENVPSPLFQNITQARKNIIEVTNSQHCLNKSSAPRLLAPTASVSFIRKSGMAW